MPAARKTEEILSRLSTYTNEIDVEIQTGRNYPELRAMILGARLNPNQQKALLDYAWNKVSALFERNSKPVIMRLSEITYDSTNFFEVVNKVMDQLGFPRGIHGDRSLMVNFILSEVKQSLES